MMASPKRHARHSKISHALLLVAALVVAAGTAACGSNQSKDGVVYGTVLGAGGPSVVSAKRPAPARLENVTVTATRVHSGKEFDTVTSQDGAFSLRVPPGTYMVTARCSRSFEVHVRSGAKVRHNFECQFT